LVGENGSGKSTLIKVLAGYHDPDPGAKLWINGEPVRLPLLPGEYRKYAMSFVHQHLGLVPSVNVLQNLRIDALTSRRRWYIPWQEEVKKARKILTQFGLEIDPLANTEDLPPGVRALVAIVRAIEAIREAHGALEKGVLILDEPTPFLPLEDVKRLFELVREIVSHGASVIIVSHDIDELLEITDRATVLRDGLAVGTLVTKESNKDSFVEMILGRRYIPSLEKDSAGTLSKQAARASIEGLTGGTVRGFSTNVHEGEVLGLTGLLGAGFSEVPYYLFGANCARSGTLRLDGVPYDLTRMSPPGAMSAKIVLIPADRQTMGCALSLTVAENISLPVLSTAYNPWKLNHRAIHNSTLSLLKQFDVRPSDPSTTVHSLSGGNQQKVLLAKWLQASPSLVLLDEPTQGVDVGARQQIFGILRRLSESGVSIICASSDYEELAEICDRVIIFSRGQAVSELQGDEIAKEHIAEHCYRSTSAIVQA
jgi:ribose transport system ATP-binding protein